jgi:hypothetical protein
MLVASPQVLEKDNPVDTEPVLRTRGKWFIDSIE